MEFRLDQAMGILQQTPAVLRALLQDVSDRWVYNNYGAKTFNPFDVVGHLIHGERTDWMPRAKMILQHGEAKTFEPFDRYAMYEGSKGNTIDQLLETFEVLRKGNLETLRAMNLTPEELALRGTHPELGPVTMQQLLATWVVHDLNHFHQIAKCMAWQYKDAVGPWLPYVGVLKPASS